MLRHSLTFFTLFNTAELQNCDGPTGQPRREKPSLTKGISGGSELESEAVGLEEKRSDLALLSINPLGGPSCSMMAKAEERSDGAPTRVPSFKYHLLILRLGTSTLILSTMDCKATANPKGPRGSPCWTPLQLRIHVSPPVQTTALDWACQNTTREHKEQLPLHHTRIIMDNVRRDISEKAGPVVANSLGDVLEGGKVHLEDSVNGWKHRAGGAGA